MAGPCPFFMLARFEGRPLDSAATDPPPATMGLFSYFFVPNQERCVVLIGRTRGAKLMYMALNSGKVGATALRSMAKKATAPRRRLQGVQVPVHLLDLLAEIQAVENAAYLVMGGESKRSLSDIVSEAIEEFVSSWLADNGEIPAGASDRREFVKKLAERNREKLLAELFEKKTH